MSTPPPIPGSPALCARHPGRPTALTCTRCGRPACPDCLREASVGQHCVDCVAAAERSAPRYRGGSSAGRPVVVVTLIVVNVAVYVLTAVTGGLATNDASPLFDLAALVPVDVAGGQWWRLVTSGFLHFGLLHLAFNMLALWVIGNDLERFLGPLRFVVLYGLSLLGGSAAVMVLTNPESSVAGASGAVFGLMGALAVLLLRRGSVTAARPALTIIGINLVLSFTLSGLSIEAHLGGLFTGALVALVMTRSRRPSTKRKRHGSPW